MDQLIIQPLVPSVLLILIGSFSHFKPFLRDRKEINQQVSRCKKTIAEKHALLLNELLKHAVSVCETDNIRGDGREDRDLPGELSGFTLKSAMCFHRVDFLLNIYNYAAMAVFLGVIAGVVGFLVVMLVGISAYIIVFYITLGGAMLQVLLVCIMRVIEGKLDRHENNL